MLTKVDNLRFNIYLFKKPLIPAELRTCAPGLGFNIDKLNGIDLQGMYLYITT